MILIKNILLFPSLFLHEMCHVVIGLLFGLKIYNIHFSSLKEKSLYAYVRFDDDGQAKSKIGEFFVSFSPFLISIISIILLLVSFNTITIFIFIYVLFSLRINIPSKVDFIRFFFYHEIVKIHKNIVIVEDAYLIIDDFLLLSYKEIIKKNIKKETKEKLSKLN